MLVLPLPFFPVLSSPSFPSPCGGGALGSGAPVPSKPCWSTDAARTPPPAHAWFPGASPQGLAPQPHRAFTVSSCCSHRAGKGPEIMFPTVSTLPCQPETTLSAWRHGPWVGVPALRSGLRSLSFPAPLSTLYPKTGVGEALKFSLTFWTAFNF